MDSFHARLNSTAYLPDGAYRRNTVVYPLICYVNCLMGCRISANLAGAVRFTDRIQKFVRQHPAPPGYELYYALVEEYLALLASLGSEE